MDWITAPVALVGAVLLLLAAWILYLRPTARLHRALALLFGARGLLAILVWLDSEFLSLPNRLAVYLIIAIPFAAANVAYLYGRLGSAGSGRRMERAVVRTVLLALLVVFEAAYLVDHSLYLDPDLRDGPFTLFFPAFLASFALVGLAAALAWRRATTAVKRQGHFVVALAFLAEPSFETGFRIMTWADAASTIGPLELADLLLRLIMAVTILVALAVFAAPARSRCPASLHLGPEERTATSLLGVSLLTGLAVYAAFQALPLLMAAALLWIMNAFWLLAMAVGLVYAVVRYQVLDSGRLVRVAIRQSTFAAVLGVIFVVASEALEVMIDAPDQTVAIGVAVTLAAAFRLLHRMTGMMVQRLVPLVDDAPKGADPTEVYEAALEGILVDGAVTRKERLVLDALVDKLALDPDEARRLEEAVLVRVAGAG